MLVRSNRLLAVAVFGFIWVLMFVASRGYNFVDETENMLGGRYINDGYPAYRGFFSQHMPLAYEVAAIIRRVTGEDVALFRAAWATLKWLLLVSMAGYLRKTLIAPYLPILGVIVALTSLFYWEHLLLAETIISHLLIFSALILVFRVLPGQMTRSDLYLLCWMALSMVLSSLAYVFLGAVIALAAMVCFWRQVIRTSHREVFHVLVVGAIPTVLIAAYFAINGNLADLIAQTFEFNSQYYARFSAPGLDSVSGWLWVSVWGFPLRAMSIFQRFGDPAYAVMNAHLLANGAVLMWFALNCRYGTLGVMGLLTVFSLNVRTMHQYHANAEVTFHIMPYVLLAITQWLIVISGVITALCEDTEAAQSARRWAVRALGVVSLLIAIWGLPVPVERGLRWGREWPTTTDIFGVAHLQPKHFPYAVLFNHVLQPGETMWIGPLRWEEMLFTQARGATRYLYFLPYMADSPTLTQDMLNDLAQNQPPIIVLDMDFVLWDRWPFKEYGRALIDFVNERYVLYGTPSPYNIYVLRTREAELRDRLSRADVPGS